MIDFFVFLKVLDLPFLFFRIFHFISYSYDTKSQKTSINPSTRLRQRHVRQPRRHILRNRAFNFVWPGSNNVFMWQNAKNLRRETS